jgi:uncharacterized membrane protein
MPKKKRSIITDSGCSHEVSEKEQLGLHRLIFFSDAVFAISITLLVLEVRLPHIEGTVTSTRLISALLALWPKYLGYIASFLVVGVFWIQHHERFQLIERYNSALLLLNLLELMCIAFIPFPTAVLQEHRGQIGTMFYSLVLTLTSLMMWVNWWYTTSNNRLINPRVDSRKLRHSVRVAFWVFIIFLCSSAAALIDARISRVGWAIGVAYFWWRPFRKPVPGS